MSRMLEIPVRTSQQYPLGIKTIPLDKVSKTPMDEAIERYLSRATNLRTQTYYDTVRLSAGTPWTKGQSTRLFQRGREQDGKILNTGVGLVKTDFDTNMIENGEFEGGVTVIVTAFECLCIPFPIKANGAFGGAISDPTAAAAQPAGYSATLLELALMNQTKWTFERGSDTREENGLLIDIPASSGLSASYGGQSNEQLVQNTLGHSKKLDFPKIIKSDSPFAVLIEPLADSLAMPVDISIRFRMVTKRIRED